jgi:hypothetical protein
MQSLVEKHFPAPDRERVNKILGLDAGKKNASNNSVKNNNEQDAGKGGVKRKVCKCR